MRHATAPTDNCDTDFDVTIELGSALLTDDEVRQLCAGSVVKLGSLPGDPVDVVVDGRLVARGELVVIDETFCVRVVELVAAAAA